MARVEKVGRVATPAPETRLRDWAAGAPPVCFVVAMRSEAEPLIDELGLERWPGGSAPFPLFRSDQTALVVSGVGKVAAAAATLYLFARLGEPKDAAWINLGIAGHRARPIGAVVLAHKVTDAGLGRSWFPPLVFESCLATSEVVTVDQVERSYPADAVYDMEAAGFVSAAGRLASAELVQVLKVVSDNVNSPVEKIDRAKIRGCIGERVAEARALQEALRELAGELAATEAEDTVLSPFLERWHFTVSQERRLRRTLQRLRAVAAESDASSPEWSGLGSAREVLEAMDEAVERRFLAVSAKTQEQP